MPNPAAGREQRLRKTKAQLIEEIDTLEQRTDELEPGREQAFPASEEMFRSAFETAVLGMNLVTPDGHFLAVNNALCEMLGYSEEELLATNIQCITHPEDIDRDLANLRALHAGEIPSYQLEKRYVHKRRHLIEVLLSVSLIRNSNGEPMYSVGNIQDITERKQADAELAKKETQLRIALDNMPGGMFMIDNELTFQVINDRYKEMFNLPADVVRTGGLLRDSVRIRAERGDYGSGDVDELVEQRLRGYTDRETLRTEEQLPSGRVIEFLRTSTDEGGTVGIATDITNRKRAEEAVRESEERLALALKGGDLGFWDINLETGEHIANDKWAEMLGYRLDDVVDFREIALNSFHPDDRDRVNQYNQRNAAGEIDDYEIEYRVVTRQGETRWQLSKGGIVRRDDQGKLQRMVGTVLDITERKQMEEALRKTKQSAEDASLLAVERAQMLETLSTKLSKYLSPQVYTSIFTGKQSVEIASKRKKLTVFFSDIADFTGTTDSLESEELTNLLNHYLTEMSKIALDHGATVDKYVGDAIIAFFGDPETRGAKEDARACMNMAIAMQRRMRKLRSEWFDMGLERPFEVRIGINTGFCTVGNFGSEDRMDYTIIGNEVNLAARLESHAEVGSILIAHETYSLVKDTVMAEERDTLTVKGFAKPIRTYSVVGLYDDLAEQGKIIRKEEEGIRILLDLEKRDRADAIQAIKDVLSLLED